MSLLLLTADSTIDFTFLSCSCRTYSTQLTGQYPKAAGMTINPVKNLKRKARNIRRAMKFVKFLIFGPSSRPEEYFFLCVLSFSLLCTVHGESEVAGIFNQIACTHSNTIGSSHSMKPAIHKGVTTVELYECVPGFVWNCK